MKQPVVNIFAWSGYNISIALFSVEISAMMGVYVVTVWTFTMHCGAD